MSFPILYDANLTGWKDGTLGLGVLSDAISCEVEEERNSTYELEMEYPISGIHVDDIEKGTCLYVTHDNSGEKQLFEIYSVTKNLTKMTVNARHISYRLNKATVLPCSATTLATAMVALKGNSIGTDDFSFDACGRTVSASWGFDYPLSVRSALGGVRGSLLDTYTGEYEWDNFIVKLHTKRGSNNGVTIEYAKNLTSLEAEEDAGDVFTSCIPYYKCQDETYFYSSTPVASDYTGEYTMCAPLDLTEYFDAPEGAEESWHPTGDELTAMAKDYMSKNTIGVPSTNLDVDFVELWQSEEYKNVAPLQEVKLCDTVTVHYPKFGVNVTAKVISVKWDVLANRYSSIELGDAKGSFSKTLLDITAKQIGETEDEKLSRLNKQTSERMADLNAAIANVSGLINGAKGGIFQVTDSNGDGINDGWTIAENTDLSEAQKIIKANYAGIGFSTDGGNTYKTAIDYNGIVTEALHVNEIFAENITATGTITNVSGKNAYTLDHGEIKYLYDGETLLRQRASYFTITTTDDTGSSTKKEVLGAIIFAPPSSETSSDAGASVGFLPAGYLYLAAKDDYMKSDTTDADERLLLNNVPFGCFFEREYGKNKLNYKTRYLEYHTDGAYRGVFGHGVFCSTGTYTSGDVSLSGKVTQECAGHLEYDGKEITVTIRLPQKIPMAMNVSVRLLNAKCRHVGGGYLVPSPGADAFTHNWVDEGNIEVRRGLVEDELILIFTNSAGASYATSDYCTGSVPARNTPVTMALSVIKYTVSD